MASACRLELCGRPIGCGPPAGPADAEMIGRSHANLSVASDLVTERISWVLPLLGGLLFAQAVLAGMILAPLFAVPFAVASALCLYWPITQRWHLGVYLLIIIMPFAGIPTIL